MRKAMMLLAAVAIAGAAVAIAADKDTTDVEGLIQKGLAAYKDGKVSDAISALQQAISAMQKSKEKGLASFFPKAPDGWEAGKLETNTLSGGSGGDTSSITTLSQAFTQKGENGMRVTVTLTNSEKLVEAQKGLAKMFRDPAALAAMNAGGKTTIKPFDKDGWSGWTTVEKDRNALAIAFYGAYVLNIDVNKDDAKTLETFLGATDLKGIAGTTTSKPAK